MSSIVLAENLVGADGKATDRVLDDRQVRLPFLGQAKPSGQALEQRHPEVTFQLTDLLTHSPLSQMELLCRVGKVQITRRYFECPQPIQGW
ncbi:hypothetical protein D3C76_1123900 [compost metagenome]